MVVRTANEAVANAKRYKTCQVGMCLKYTRTWLEIPSRYPSAIAAWEAAEHKHRNGVHKDAQSPPKGAPVFWRGGKYGHIAMAMSNSSGRSTDTRSSGVVSTAEGDWWRLNWNYEYLGWTEDLNGVDIPFLQEDDWRASGAVHVVKLKKGTRDSKSVSRLRWRLQHHKDIPGNRRPGLGDSSLDGANYTQDVVDASRYWMRQVWKGKKGNGENFTNAQANALFGPNYNVIEE